MTSNRLMRTDYFKTKVDGWLSLSGGRLGGNPGRSATFAPTRTPRPLERRLPRRLPRAGQRPVPAAASFAAAMAALREPPDAEISFIYTTGEREVDEKGVPETSDWATKYGCGARRGCRDRRRQGGLRLRQQPPEPAASGLGPAARAGQGQGRTRLPTARTAAWSPTSSASRRATPRGSSRSHRGADQADAVGQGRQAALGFAFVEPERRQLRPAGANDDRGREPCRARARRTGVERQEPRRLPEALQPRRRAARFTGRRAWVRWRAPLLRGVLHRLPRMPARFRGHLRPAGQVGLPVRCPRHPPQPLPGHSSHRQADAVIPGITILQFTETASASSA